MVSLVSSPLINKSGSQSYVNESPGIRLDMVKNMESSKHSIVSDEVVVPASAKNTLMLSSKKHPLLFI